MNYKIRVESEAESREAQELFFELGYHWAYKNIGRNTYYKKDDIYLYADKGGNLGTGTKENKEHFSGWYGTLVSLAELRDLVVLKRNLIDDATHVDQYGDKWRRINNKFYFYSGVGEWDDSLSHLMNRYDLKPIEKPMKEWLNTETYEYKKAVDMGGHNKWIEIPEGAEKVTLCGGFLIFWKDEFLSYSTRVDLDWKNSKEHPESYYSFTEYTKKYDDAVIIWKRETLNDQVASAETARQSEKVLKEILEGDLPEFELNIEKDNVNQPVHYCSHPSGIECIEITRHHDFAIGNAIKYLWRAGLKDSGNEIQDLEKSIWYIQDKINQLKKQNANSGKD